MYKIYSYHIDSVATERESSHAVRLPSTSPSQSILVFTSNCKCKKLDVPYVLCKLNVLRNLGSLGMMLIFPRERKMKEISKGRSGKVVH